MKKVSMILFLTIFTAFIISCSGSSGGGGGYSGGDGIITPTPTLSPSPINSPHPIVNYKKIVNYTSWYINELNSQSSKDSIGQLKGTKVEVIYVLSTWYVQNISSSNIFQDPVKSPSNIDLSLFIRNANSLGFKTGLVAHIDSMDGQWRGEINPTDVNLFFENLKIYIGQMADIAEIEECTTFVISAELKKISGTNYSGKWNEIISLVRSKFHGKITYAANWDEYQNVSFWSQLDYLGINAYFPLSSQQNPDLATLTFASDTRMQELQNWHNQYQKQVLITEVGYGSWDYAAKEPWNYSQNYNYNGELQARCYQALINSAANKTWLAGIAFWNWEPKVITNGEGQTTYSPQGKPAENILKSW